MIGRFSAIVIWAVAFLLGAPSPLEAAAKRVIIFKFDGVNAALLEKYVGQRNQRTGRSELPWIDRIFATGGTRLENFFVRGISLSAPSWAELDTGHHAVIRGNVEYDRWTLHAYDYLNFFPFYLNYSQKKQVDMPGTEVLDEAGIPLLLDAFSPAERRQSYQLYQRGNDWRILQNALPNHFKGRSMQRLFDEYETGLDWAGTVPQEQERLLIEKLNDNRIAYFDFFSGDYDHVAHLTNDPASQLAALQSLDALVGRVWSAARAAPLGPDTLFVLVSDHGMNTAPQTPSQGFSLVNWFNSAAGGAQHVITDRYPLSTFKIRGLDPLVHKVTNPSAESAYLKDQGDKYPTVLLDVDGNERAAVQLRSNDWNIAQILLQSANDPKTPADVRAAARLELGRWAEARRPAWAAQQIQIDAALAALERLEKRARAEFAQLNRSWTDADREAGKDLEARRWSVLAARLDEQQHEYRDFSKAMQAFLAMPANAAASLVPRQSLGDANTLFDLQNYVTGPIPEGLQLDRNGRIDHDRSFRRIDYFAALHAIRVRNQPPPGVSNRPVDFTAAGLPAPDVERALGESGLTAAVWLYSSDDRQAMVLYRRVGGHLEIRYLPVGRLKAAKDGTLAFDRAACAEGFPLAICDDPALSVPAGFTRPDWLSSWHAEQEWFQSLVNTRYSNGLIGLSELFEPVEVKSSGWDAAAGPEDRATALQWEQTRRSLVQPDFEIFASGFWNFNVRNFNPGGNHGGFWSASTHSVLLFSGPAIPAGGVIRQPYDSLSLTPTVLALMGRTLPDLPGPVIDFSGK